MKLTLTLLMSTALLSACATRVEYITPELPLPEPPVLPTIAADDLACLSDEAYQALAVRDALRRGYANQLRAIIEAHNLQVR